jgi:DNA-binding NarL/FixJ family response regulator
VINNNEGLYVIDTGRFKVLIATRHHVNSEGVYLRLCRDPDIHIVGSVCEKRYLEDAFSEYKPSVLLMSDTFDEIQTCQLTRQFTGNHPDANILIISNQVDRHLIMEFMESGAKGFVATWYADFADLLAAIRAVSKGDTYLCQKSTEILLGGLFNRNTPNQSEPLSVRERQVIRLISDGKSSKEIARILNISPHTVEVHRRNIMRKIGAHKTADLTRYAIRFQLATV